MFNLKKLLLNAGKRWYHQDMSIYAAAFSYYAPLAIIPLLVFTIYFVGIFYSEEIVRTTLTGWGESLGQGLVDLLKSAITRQEAEVATFKIPLIGFVVSLIACIASLNVLAGGFHRLWQVKESGVRNWLLKSLRSFFFILVFQFYLTSVITFSFFLNLTNLNSVRLIYLAFLLFCSVIFFTLMFRLLTSHAPSWSGSLVAGIITAVLFTFVKWAMNFYLATIPSLSFFGAAGLILILLIWSFILAVLIFLGAAIALEYDKLKTLTK